MNYNEVVDAVDAITGWETSLWELIQIGDRRLQMMRAFNIASGLSSKDDCLPPRMFEPLKGGVTEGKVIDEDVYQEALANLYELMGWDKNGKPGYAKLAALDLEWVYEKFLKQ